MNKKIILMGALAIALAVAGGYGVKTSMNNNVQLSDLAMANIEALAKLEAPKVGDNGCNIEWVEGEHVVSCFVNCQTGRRPECTRGSCRCV